MSELYFISNQITVEVRRETVDGTNYLVAPVVAIKPGVMNGEYVPAEEIAVHYGSWDGRPFVLGHPVNEEGESVSANDPATLARLGLGNLFHTQFTDDGRLLGELWIDVARAKGLGGDGLEVLRRLEKGDPLEVSTAYFRDREETPGEVDGIEYEAVARNLHPDHLAALLDVQGACSWEDGCGAPRVNEEDRMQTNVLSEARKPTYDGTEEISWADVTKSFEAYRDGYYKNTEAEKPDEEVAQVTDAPAPMREWIAARSLLGDPEAEDWRNLSFFPVVNPGTNRLNAGAVRAVLGGRAAQARTRKSRWCWRTTP